MRAHLYCSSFGRRAKLAGDPRPILNMRNYSRIDVDKRSPLEICLEILEFPAEDLQAFDRIPPLISSEGVETPAKWFRDRIYGYRLNPATDPNFILRFGTDSLITRSEEWYTMHTAVWFPQCVARYPLQNPSASLPVCTVKVPNLNPIGAFIRWLYTNDEETLYKYLIYGNEQTSCYTIDFCRIVRVCGCVNHRLLDVVKAVYQT